MLGVPVAAKHSGFASIGGQGLGVNAEASVLDPKPSVRNGLGFRVWGLEL